MRNAIVCSTACTAPIELCYPYSCPTLTRGEMQRDYILRGKLLLKWFKVKRNGARTNCSRRLFNSWNSLPAHRIPRLSVFRVSCFKNGRFAVPDVLRSLQLSTEQLYLINWNNYTLYIDDVFLCKFMFLWMQQKEVKNSDRELFYLLYIINATTIFWIFCIFFVNYLHSVYFSYFLSDKFMKIHSLVTLMIYLIVCTLQ